LEYKSRDVWVKSKINIGDNINACNERGRIDEKDSWLATEKRAY